MLDLDQFFEPDTPQALREALGPYFHFCHAICDGRVVSWQKVCAGRFMPDRVVCSGECKRFSRAPDSCTSVRGQVIDFDPGER